MIERCLLACLLACQLGFGVDGTDVTDGTKGNDTQTRLGKSREGDWTDGWHEDYETFNPLSPVRRENDKEGKG